MTGKLLDKNHDSTFTKLTMTMPEYGYYYYIY